MSTTVDLHVHVESYQRYIYIPVYTWYIIHLIILLKQLSTAQQAKVCINAPCLAGPIEGPIAHGGLAGPSLADGCAGTR